MKKAFSLLELIMVLLIVSFLLSFIVFKYKDSIELSNRVKIKSDIALIRSSISKLKTKRVLLNSKETIILDKAPFNTKNKKLFKNILDFPLISSSDEDKEIGKWIKKSNEEYKVYIDKNNYLLFVFKDNSFKCKSKISLCEDYE